MPLINTYQKLVALLNTRKHTFANENHLFAEGKKMAQARTLNEKELNLLLLYINTRKYATRDRAMILLSYWAGMRVGEIAAVKVGDVLALDGTMKPEIRLTAEQTKGRHPRTVTLSDKMRKELLVYVQDRYATKQLIPITYSYEMKKPLFFTQKREGFDSNTACYHFHMLYRAAGLEGASSHSGRRSFLTSLSAKSVPLKVLMDLAGHRQAQTTMRYINVTADMKAAAVNLL